MNDQKNMDVESRPTHGPGPEVIARLVGLPQAQPRFYKFRIGVYECVSLSDGGIPVPKPLMTGVPMAGPPEFVLLPLSCLLVRMPDSGKWVLIDTGFGPMPKRGGMPFLTGGRAVESLAMVGVKPEDIDIVLASHLHPDHVNGMYSDEGIKIYPNASYHAGAEEVAFWSKIDLDLSASPAPEPVKQDMIAAARRLLDFAGDSLITFRAGEEAIPGIRTMLAPGHTPTQIAFILSSQGESLLYTADAFAFSNSVEVPEQHNPFDLEPNQAALTRKKLVGLLMEQGWHSFTPHFSWPSVGHVEARESDSAWLACV
jgi:glyoxylase-like metal-dependent hydrolase (beta-lactamase superfamily II)